MWADKALVSGNTIDTFSFDGIDYLPGDGIQIVGNTIKNSVDSCEPPPNVPPATVCPHQDGIQGQFIYNDPSKLGQNVLIARNRIVVQSRPDLKFPSGGLQGITAFDGNWKNVTIVNNTAIINAYHAITMGGATNGLIANNTVLNTNPTRNAWIVVGGTHQGFTSSNVTVRNNIANQIKNTTDAATNLVVDHNLATKDPSAVFTAFDPSQAVFDLHLKIGSPAIGAGSAERAPVTDIEGKKRSVPLDEGAYAYP